MYPAKFDYYRATSVAEAVSLLQEHGEEAKVLAGGHSLIPMMKLRLAQPPVLIDLSPISELQGITKNEDGSVRIGAMTTYAAIASADTGLGALTDACSIIGDIQVRNRGTIGGNLAHNDPAGDLPAVALALEAEISAVGPDGSRTIGAADFIVDLLETDLSEDEVLTSVTFPTSGGSAYAKFENPASGYAICAVAAMLEVGDDGTISKCRVAVNGVSDYAQRLNEVEEALEGQAASSENFAAAAANAGQDLDFLSDIHADEAYRAHLTKVLTRRALEEAAARA
jgi:carbon-monoxide dehydrogenase medium subunit